MFEKPQIDYKNDMVDKRTYDAHSGVMPTSILVNQTLARSFFLNDKKVKVFSNRRCMFKFK